MLPDGYAPSNLVLRGSTKVRYIDGDVFDICKRLAAIDPRLYVVQLEGKSRLTGKTKAVWAVMERCLDGVSRMVCKVPELDARALEKVQMLMRVPFHVRLRQIEEENERWEKEYHDNELERIYERMGHAFRYQLWHDGFIEHRGVSYPKVGVAAPGRIR